MRHRQSHRSLTTTRIYQRRNRFYYFSPTPIQNPLTGRVTKWHSLCHVREGEHRARELAAALLATGPKTRGAMPKHLDDYRLALLKRREAKRPQEPARSKMFDDANKEITRVCGVIAAAFEDFDPGQVLPVDVATFLDQWAGQRMAQVYHARLSDFFTWCARRGLATTNPVRDVRVEKPEKRTRYVTHAEFHAARDALLVGKDGRATASGPMVQCYVDLCYLLYQRTTEIRLLKWSQIGHDVIHFKPTKTERSSGASVTVPISPQVRAVLERARTVGRVKSLYIVHNLRGQPYTSRGLGDAWERACEVGKVLGATLKDIRAKAATDAKRGGYTKEQISVGLAHTTVEMTETYLRGLDAEVSEVVISLPPRV